MKKSVTILAPAKINLHLHVLERNADGYHDVRTLFQMISLCDEIFFTVDTDRKGVDIENGVTALREDDLIYKAYAAFSTAANLEFYLHGRVNKRIPMQAGLGGGSSDCAATLTILNTVFDTILPAAALSDLARDLGSDVPFFLGSPAAYGCGRGEILTPVKPAGSLHVLILNVPKPMDTGFAYRRLDEGRLTGGNGPDEKKIIEAYETMPPADWPFFNTFFELYREDRDYKLAMEIITGSGAVFTSLTGSGAALYGLFFGYDSARKAQKAVSFLGDTWLVEVLERKPVAVLE